MTRSHPSNRIYHLLALIALLFALCLAAATPAFAADPEEADPDPGVQSTESSTRLLVLSDLAELDRDRLAPGRYLVRIVDGGRTTAVFEIVVK